MSRGRSKQTNLTPAGYGYLDLSNPQISMLYTCTVPRISLDYPVSSGHHHGF
jgi:hypothetical protein